MESKEQQTIAAALEVLKVLDYSLTLQDEAGNQHNAYNFYLLIKQSDPPVKAFWSTSQDTLPTIEKGAVYQVTIEPSMDYPEASFKVRRIIKNKDLIYIDQDHSATAAGHAIVQGGPYRFPVPHRTREASGWVRA